ncbi:MAG: glutamyl-tRNA reductase, partial [Planctomycetes bacterium]|nr:glutamyl-tRNA reductase [Planctomycetota bacterium]
MERFIVTGLNHKFAPIEIRECLAFADQALPMALRSLREDFGVPQAVILSTCNRVEIIAFGKDRECAKRVRGFLSDFHHVEESFFSDHLYEHRGEDAVKHLFRVSSSLDSLVLGEYQILSQLKTAYQIATQEGTCGKAINALMQRAFALAKEVRARTAIGAGQLSVASVAVGFIKRTFENLAEKTVLLLGAGETAQITLRHLREAGVQDVIIANRTLEKAKELAEIFGGAAIPLDLVADYLPKADIVVSQTGATQPIITKKMVAKALKYRASGSLFFVDLAVPRDIATDVDRLDGVYRYDVDDLE